MPFRVYLLSSLLSVKSQLYVHLLAIPHIVICR